MYPLLKNIFDDKFKKLKKDALERIGKYGYCKQAKTNLRKLFENKIYKSDIKKQFKKLLDDKKAVKNQMFIIAKQKVSLILSYY
jgi:hypothetical protein